MKYGLERLFSENSDDVEPLSSFWILIRVLQDAIDGPKRFVELSDADLWIWSTMHDHKAENREVGLRSVKRPARSVRASGEPTFTK